MKRLIALLKILWETRDENDDFVIRRILAELDTPKARSFQYLAWLDENAERVSSERKTGMVRMTWYGDF